MLRCQDIAYLFGIFREFGIDGGTDVTAGSSDLEGILTSLGNPLAVSLVERSQFALLYLDGQCLLLTGFQFARLGEALQLMTGFLDVASRSSNIDLSNLLTSYLARILDGDGNGDHITVHLNGSIAIFKSGLAETVTDGISHILVERVEIPVADIDILVVVGIVIAGESSLVALSLLE